MMIVRRPSPVGEHITFGSAMDGRFDDGSGRPAKPVEGQA
jgi:hypothetical protein